MKFRKFVSLALIFCFVLACFTLPCSAATKKKKKKYVKVKSATYQTYKKAYKENAQLRAKIRDQEKTINNLKNNNNVSQIAKELEKTKEELENQKSMNKWVWSNIKSMGISYNSKTWTIPEEYPTSFMVDGVKYVVVLPETETTGGE